VLYWSVSPSGKLPYTIAKLASDYGNSIRSGSDNFAEGVFIDYRPSGKANIAPRSEFGFGFCVSLSLLP
jgi:beta-glucosidase